MNEQDLTRYINQKIIEIGQALMSYYDPCQHRNGTCKAGDPNPCCSGHTIFGQGCPFWHDRCTFINADCVLWICETAVKSTDPKCVEALQLLERLGHLYGLVRRPLIGEPYKGADKP